MTDLSEGKLNHYECHGFRHDLMPLIFMTPRVFLVRDLATVAVLTLTSIWKNLFDEQFENVGASQTRQEVRSYQPSPENWVS